MDSSYWSKENVVKATRDFVCIRLATYEDTEEVKFLANVYRGRSGQLENTVFALLDSDGKKRLARSGRSPDFAFQGDRQFVSGLEQIAREKGSPKKRFSDPALPLVKNVDLGLNVASCDGIQMILVVGEDEARVRELSQKALPLAWNDQVGGQFVFATATTVGELRPLGLKKLENGIYVVNPGQFGMSGQVVASWGEDFDAGEVTKRLAELCGSYQVNKNYQQHIQTGIGLGIEWKTETPVTDQQSLRATQRARGR